MACKEETSLKWEKQEVGVSGEGDWTFCFFDIEIFKVLMWYLFRSVRKETLTSKVFQMSSRNSFMRKVIRISEV